MIRVNKPLFEHIRQMMQKVENAIEESDYFTSREKSMIYRHLEEVYHKLLISAYEVDYDKDDLKKLDRLLEERRKIVEIGEQMKMTLGHH